MNERESGFEPERDELERSHHEDPVTDPAGRPEPYVDGPTGPAPLASELRGDPGADGDRAAEGGAVGGVIAGTAAAGPLGGVVGGVVGATIGTAADSGDDRDETVDAAERQAPAQHEATADGGPGREG